MDAFLSVFISVVYDNRGPREFFYWFDREI